MAKSTDADYNSDMRVVNCKADIHFSDKVSLAVLPSDYLIHMDLLEELNTEDISPISGVSSNELMLTLNNDKGMFSPTNEASEYYGLMKRGIPIDLSMQVNEKEWDLLGTFYVTDWQAALTGTTADITANDMLYSVFALPQVAMPIKKQIAYISFIKAYFDALNVDVTVDATLVDKLKYAYVQGNVKEFLSDLMNGAAANCFCNHTGRIVVASMYRTRGLRATLSENDQLINADAIQTINASYEGSEVICNTPQESSQTEIINVKDLKLPVGLTLLPSTSLSASPMLRVLGAAVQKARDVHVYKIQSTQDSIAVTLNNESDAEVTVDVVAYGNTLNTVATKFSDEVENMLSVDSKYIQSTAYAKTYKKRLETFVANKLPCIDVNVRGNPLLELGDKVLVSSAKYNIYYTGVILRAKYVYDGSLSCTLTLLNAATLQESEA